MVFKFVAEFPDGILDRPGGSVSQSADGCAGHDPDRFADVEQRIEILESSFAVLDSRQDSFGPACPFTTGSALAARFVSEEAAGVVEEIDHGDGDQSG